MAGRVAAGLLMCRFSEGELEYLLVHPGGPYFQNKHKGVWTIPKGLPEAGESYLETAQREFVEETGIKPAPPFHFIGTIQQKGGKVIHGWTFVGSWNDENGITCNNFSVEWPPRSGRMASFPEVDKAKWVQYNEATQLLIPEQIPFLQRAREVYKDRLSIPPAEKGNSKSCSG
jgi:predicted NUDIX family NTP pyrophosphohydrolase